MCDIAEAVFAASRGRAFVLFTSYRALEFCAARLRGRLPWPILVQGDAPRARLLAEFRRLGNAVLFGTALNLDADGFAKAERLTDRTGKSFLVAQRKWLPQEGAFIDRFEVRFAGLPARGWGAYLAAALVAVVVATGSAYAWHRRGARELAADSRDDLVEAREALLAELAELERAAKRGDVGPKSYARLRQAMLDALARILALLEGDAGKAATVPASGAGADLETTASRDDRASEEASNDDAEVRAARARKRKTGVRRAP